MSFTVNKRIISDGNAVKVDCGALVISADVDINVATGQTPSGLKYNRQHEQEDSMYGIVIAAAGDKTVATSAAAGIASLDEKLHGVLVPNPAGGDDDFRVPTIWAASGTDYSGLTDRSATTAGSVVWPPSGSRNEMVYELKTGTSTGDSEPTGGWPTTPGAEATDGGSNVWTAREQNTVVRGAQGITIGADTQTDSQICLIECTCQDREDVDINVGDVANLTSDDYA